MILVVSSYKSYEMDAVITSFIQQLQAGMQVAEFVLYLGVIAGFSTYFNQITMQLMGFP